MKIRALLLLVLTAVLALVAPRTSQARADVSFDYFYESLLPYGEWIEVADYGFCWRPTEVDADWVPYSDGYWAFTDAGWTWVGYEEFAGIVYHYGRWIFVEAEGWCWVPDYEWGPAWVSWRNNDDYIGWAPLPPKATWQPEIGISTWVDTVSDIGPGFYSFCSVRDFGAPVLRPVIINRSRNVTIIRTTVNVTNITYNTFGSSPVIYNGGPSYTYISSRCQRPIPALKLVRTTHFDRPDFRGGPGRFSPNARTLGNQLLVNAPIVAPPVQPGFLQDKVKRTFAADKVRTGWTGVKDPRVREDLRQHFRRETKGLTPYTAPARAVVVSDLKVVPTQADPNAASPVFTGKGPRGKGDRQPPVITANPIAPVQPAGVPPDATTPADPRTAGRMEREKVRGKNGDTIAPPAVTGVPLKPVNPDANANPSQIEPGTPTNPIVTVPGTNKTERENRGPKKGQDQPQPPVMVVPQNPVVVAPPVAPVVVAPSSTGQPTAPVEPRAGRDPRPMKDDAAAGQAQSPAEAAKVAREQENPQRQKMELEKRRVTQEADQARGEQERMARQREAAADAAAQQQKQAAAAAAASTEKAKMQSQREQRADQEEREKIQADQQRMTRQRDTEAAAKQAQMKRQQTEAQAQESQRQQQEQIAAQRRQQQMEQQRTAQEAAKQQAAEQRRQQQMEQQGAAQEAAKQQAAEQRRQQQMEQQRAAQEAAKQQAVEQRRQQQMEQQRAAQEAVKQQAAEQSRRQQMEQQQAAQESANQQAEQQRRAMDAQREQAARQQMEAQRAAQQQAAQAAQAAQQAAQDARRGEKDKEKDNDKGR